MNIPILFGRFLVRTNKISEEELSKILRVQLEIKHSYASIALEHDLITIDDFKRALEYQRQGG